MFYWKHGIGCAYNKSIISFVEGISNHIETFLKGALKLVIGLMKVVSMEHFTRVPPLLQDYYIIFAWSRLLLMHIYPKVVNLLQKLVRATYVDSLSWGWFILHCGGCILTSLAYSTRVPYLSQDYFIVYLVKMVIHTWFETLTPYFSQMCGGGYAL